MSLKISIDQPHPLGTENRFDLTRRGVKANRKFSRDALLHPRAKSKQEKETVFCPTTSDSSPKKGVACASVLTNLLSSVVLTLFFF